MEIRKTFERMIKNERERIKMKKKEDVKVYLELATKDFMKLYEKYNFKCSKQMKYNILSLKTKIPVIWMYSLECSITNITDNLQVNNIFTYYYSNWELYKHLEKKKTLTEILKEMQ